MDRLRSLFAHSTFKRIAGFLLPALVLVFAGLALHRFLQGLTWAQVESALAALPLSRILLAVAATGISFTALGIYDVFAVRVAARGRVPWTIAALAGAAGTAVSNTLGFHVITGGALRYRIYARYGLSLGDVGRITSLAFAGLGLGYVGTIALALWFRPDHLLSAALLALTGAGFWFLARKSRRITIGKWSVTLPDGKTAFYLMLVGTFEMTAAACALYVLLPAEAVPDMFTFILIYIGAIWLGVISHVPGGAGVFEATMLTALPQADRGTMLAAFIVYRCVYSFLPFACACVAVAVYEWAARRR